MRICQQHWEELHAAIKARGLWDLVATSGEEAMSQALDELAGVPKTLDRYDPLMAANWSLMNNALACGGLYLMFQKEDGSHYCPVCEAEKHGQKGWIEKAADGAAHEAEKFKSKGQG